MTPLEKILFTLAAGLVLILIVLYAEGALIPDGSPWAS